MTSNWTAICWIILAYYCLSKGWQALFDHADDRYFEGKAIGYSNGWEIGYRAGLPSVHREPERSEGVHLPTE